MKRRHFPTILAGATIGAASGTRIARTETEPSRPVLMHVGCQRFAADSVKNLQNLKRHGVDHMCGLEPEYLPDGG